jgi:hypothetical protein
VATYNPYLEKYRPVETPLSRRTRGVPGWQRMGFILLFIAVIVPLLLAVKPAPLTGSELAAVEAITAPVQETQTSSETAVADAAPPASSTGGISPAFAAPVQYWADQIVAWSAAYGLDPNIAATIMQIESCGDPQAVSSAGAQGLFQVMPFHFAAGENALDPDTNARRGLNYYVERLQQTNGDTGLAFAGYNGGHRAAGSSWDSWAHETQRYYVWSTGIYGDIQNGLSESPTLQEWMQAGGASLCNQAARNLGLTQ